MAIRVTKGHREREEKRIPLETNRNLYDELMELSMGDDYDGCFTPIGRITHGLLKEEFEKRLADWLDDGGLSHLNDSCTGT